MSKINKVLLTTFVFSFVMLVVNQWLYAQGLEAVVLSPLGEWLDKQPWWGVVYLGITTVLLIANNITSSLPSSIQGSSKYNMFMKVLNFMSYNFGHNKNADDKPLNVSNKPPE